MAEEKKINGGKTEQKLTYEQLSAYAQQTQMQAKKIWEENQMLKQALNEANLTNNFKEVELALKCLDHVELFSPEFIEKIVKRLEEVLTPQTEEKPEETPKEKKEE